MSDDTAPAVQSDERFGEQYLQGGSALPISNKSGEGLEETSPSDCFINYELAISRVFSEHIEDGKLCSAEVQALARLLLRCNRKDVLSHLDENVFTTPEELYSWGIVNANVAFPCISLKDAAERLNRSSGVNSRWGFTADGKIHMPLRETVAHSHVWNILIALVEKLYPNRVVRDYVCDIKCPLWDPADTTDNAEIEIILTRIIELDKNPWSATIRTGSSNHRETMIRNSVDFVVLDHIYQKSKDYLNLSIAPIALLHGRKKRKLEQVTKVKGQKKKRSTFMTIYSGYALSSYLLKYVSRGNIKDEDQEDIVLFFLSLLRDIADRKCDQEDWSIPKAFFESPSIQIRSGIRKGPAVRTKDGTRQNLYIPFSFVKSSECASYPEVTKKELISVGNELLIQLDNVNKLTPKEGNEKIPYLKSILQFFYIASDTCRRQWREHVMIPSMKHINDLFDGDIKSLIESVNSDSFNEMLNRKKIALRNLRFSPAYDDPEQIKDIKSAISQNTLSRKIHKVPPKGSK